MFFHSFILTFPTNSSISKYLEKRGRKKMTKLIKNSLNLLFRSSPSLHHQKSKKAPKRTKKITSQNGNHPPPSLLNTHLPFKFCKLALVVILHLVRIAAPRTATTAAKVLRFMVRTTIYGLEESPSSAMTTLIRWKLIICLLLLYDLDVRTVIGPRG